MFDTMRKDRRKDMLFQKKKEVQMKIEGMHCDACKRSIGVSSDRN